MKAKIIPVILSVIALLSACSGESEGEGAITDTAYLNTDTSPDIPEDPPEETAADSGSETAADDIYITVTDAEGCEKVLYYLPSESGEAAFIYMSSDVEGAEDMLGYAPAMSENLPAVKKEMPFGSELENMLSSSSFGHSYISYYISEGALSFCSIEEGSDELSEICRLMSAAKPDIIPVPEAEGTPEGDGADEKPGIEATEGFYDYNSRYPIESVLLSDRMGSISSTVIVYFGMYEDRLAVKYYTEDYSALEELAMKNSATEEELRAAYEESFVAESEWFRADSIENEGGLYDLLLETVMKSEGNRLE